MKTTAHQTNNILKLKTKNSERVLQTSSGTSRAAIVYYTPDSNSPRLRQKKRSFFHCLVPDVEVFITRTSDPLPHRRRDSGRIVWRSLAIHASADSHPKRQKHDERTLRPKRNRGFTRASHPEPLQTNDRKHHNPLKSARRRKKKKKRIQQEKDTTRKGYNKKRIQQEKDTTRKG